MYGYETASAGLRVETVINPATGEPVKVSESTAKAIVATWGQPDAFVRGYQARLADEWQERHAKPRRYVVHLRGGEPLEEVDAVNHSDQGEWVVFYGTDGETLMTIKQADVISVRREPLSG